MSQKNNPIKQHDLPATYLRRFAIDPDSVSHKRVVWCYRQINSKHLIDEKSVHATLFKTVDFYTVPNHEHPYAIEEFFSKEIEPRYELIMKDLCKEANLPFECRQNLILWLHFNKLRNRNKRVHLQKIVDKHMMVNFVPKFGLKLFNDTFNERMRVVEQQAKEIQINSFADKDLLNHFDKGIGSKHWLILKTPKSEPFITSDNPGFSININEDKADFHTLSNSFAINAAATNYFILSPEYCLVISPFYADTPIEVNVSNQEIEFKRIGKTHREFINYCTIQTHSKYIVSNQEHALKRVVEFFNKVKSNG